LDGGRACGPGQDSFARRDRKVRSDENWSSGITLSQYGPWPPRGQICIISKAFLAAEMLAPFYHFRQIEPRSVIMAKIVFTPNVQRHVLCPEAEAPGQTVREVLDNVFTVHADVRGYVLDDQSRLRKHMTIFVDGRMIRDRVGLSDAVDEASMVYVFQALSGG
jgi:molybdopterin synthase sulfur carrier subunit